MLSFLVDRFKREADTIRDWLIHKQNEIGADPLYASVDIRNAGYKLAPVDTNLFPGGFNNLCPSFRRAATELFKMYFHKFYPKAKNILILAEDHTRNLFYFDNLIVLRDVVRNAGVNCEIANFSTELVQEMTEFTAASGGKLEMYRPELVGDQLKIAAFVPDIIIVNNDFSSGVPELIKKIIQPLLPTPFIGWHSRKKSDHFTHYEQLATDFSKAIDIDPWLISSYFDMMEQPDFSDDTSMQTLATKVDVVLKRVGEKYKQHNINETPYVFVKNDAGTYGMAVMTASSGDEFLSLNKKQRNKMKTGKSGRAVTDVIIQEGVRTIDRFKERVAEPVIYLINHQVCGGFFRLHETVDDRGNLNQPGVQFTKLCFHELTGYSNEYKGQCDLECLQMILVHIARIASLAAGCEIKHV
ncbi:glutamate--cysteine ligase [Candidatus Gracilibacteria bacterium]|nr:glutamate--cysteine ligase [Candidatus Gracilibacteria bacterium]